MHVAVGSDDAGFDLKVILRAEVIGHGHAIDDLSTRERRQDRRFDTLAKPAEALAHAAHEGTS